MIVDGLALLVGGVAALFAFLTYRLARRQDARRPELALANIELLALDDDADLAEDIKSTRERFEETQRERRERARRAAQARREREQREEEQRREREEREELEERQRRDEAGRGPLNRPNFDPTSRVSPLADLARNITPGTQQYHLLQFHTPTEPYGGPFPDAYIEAEIKNVGKGVAYEVTAWLTLQKSALEPVQYFAGPDVEIIADEEGTVTLELRAQKESGRLLLSENNWHRFQIPVMRHSTEGTTLATYEITSPQGGSTSGEVELALDLPELPPDEDE